MCSLESFGGRDAGVRSILCAGRQESCILISLGKCTAPSRGVFLKARVSHGRGFRCERPRGVGQSCGEVCAAIGPTSRLKSGGTRPWVPLPAEVGGRWQVGGFPEVAAFPESSHLGAPCAGSPGPRSPARGRPRPALRAALPGDAQRSVHPPERPQP